jgi:hypothetical protein
MPSTNNNGEGMQRENDSLFEPGLILDKGSFQQQKFVGRCQHTLILV